MDAEVVAALDRSPVSVKTFVAPRGLHAVVWVVCATTFAMVVSEASVREGGWAYEGLLKWVPGLAGFTQWARVYVLLAMLLIHVTEAYLMTKRMEKHSVKLFGAVWWAWVGTCFVEGYGAFQR
jgi:hypothetical protein